jgi:hypothetical protein
MGGGGPCGLRFLRFWILFKDFGRDLFGVQRWHLLFLRGCVLHSLCGRENSNVRRRRLRLLPIGNLQHGR